MVQKGKGSMDLVPTSLGGGGSELNQTVEEAPSSGTDGALASLATGAVFLRTNNVYATAKSITFTPTKAKNIIIIVAYIPVITKITTRTLFGKVTESAVDIIPEESVAVTATRLGSLFLTGSMIDVTPVSHTYNLEYKTETTADESQSVGAVSIAIFEIS